MTWDEYFLNIAKAVSLRSKDTITKVGAVLVDKDNHIIGTGYNGMPKGVDESQLWGDKHKYVLHAEVNCLAHSIKDTKDSTMYITMYPCLSCAKSIIASGIKRIVFVDAKYFSDEACNLFISAGISVEQLI